jgi:predicted ATPase
MWSGDPSFEELRRRSGVPASTLSDALSPNRARPPSLSVVRRFVRACGVTPEVVAAWESAWRSLRLPGRRATARPGQAGSPEPHQLPRDVRHFVGRGIEFDRLDTLAAEDSTVVAVAGAPGIGKTSLVVQWAHRVAGDYPDGQLYLDLHGFARQPPLAAGSAMRFFLGALGVPKAEIPADGRARLALYRSLVYGRRMLVVLDNARSAEQVRMLIPGGPGCFTLVTSRDRLSGLVARDGAHRLIVESLRPDEAEALLTVLLGSSRVARERRATSDLARLCGYHPLALRVAGARLADRPTWSIAAFATRLAVGDRLTELTLAGDGSTAVREAFDLSYGVLDGRAQKLLRQLATMPADGFTVTEVAAAAPMPIGDVHRLLDTLAAAHLLELTTPDRYALGELLRLYADERLRQEGGGTAFGSRRPRPARPSPDGRLLEAG